jgi:hypothetical protein
MNTKTRTSHMSNVNVIARMRSRRANEAIRESRDAGTATP